MNITTNKGLDYSGPGSTVNRNVKTGIRYGIISQHRVMPEALDDIFTHGIDLDFEAYKLNVKDALRSALSDFFHDRKHSSGNSPLDCAVESAFDAISDSLGDGYDETADCPRMEYESDGYKLLIDGSDDLWILESEFFTYLSTPVEPDDNNKAYCLGPDWFENNKAPYHVYSVETGELIRPHWTEQDHNLS